MGQGKTHKVLEWIQIMGRVLESQFKGTAGPWQKYALSRVHIFTCLGLDITQARVYYSSKEQRLTQEKESSDLNA